MISVILCGGAGSRLWPVSRELYPKPFLRLPDGQSFMQKAFLRGMNAPQAEALVTITNREFFLKTKEEFVAFGSPMKHSYVLEPFGRNTAPAVAAAALRVRDLHGEDALMLILPSDHFISDSAAFNQAIARAQTLAEDDRLVVFGIEPSRPATEYGYIEAKGSQVIRFVEKPPLEKALGFITAGNFLWNAGIFCFKARTILQQLGIHAPELLKIVENCVQASGQASTSDGPGGNALLLNPELFAEAPNVSVDYAVMEKSDQIAVVRCDMGWSDVGSWNDFCSFNRTDGNNNRISNPGNVLLEDVHGCDLYVGDRLVTALGVSNLLIVDTQDALLVANKDKTQDVKTLYGRLKEMGHEAYKQHRTTYLPWGSFTLLETGDRFKIKRLVVKPDSAISLQRHHYRSEHWVVVKGMATVTRGDEEFFVNTNESVHIKAGERHRVTNSGKIDLVIIEVQSGDYLGEDDIERINDMYGRR